MGNILHLHFSHWIIVVRRVEVGRENYSDVFRVHLAAVSSSRILHKDVECPLKYSTERLGHLGERGGNLSVAYNLLEENFHTI